MKRLGSTIIVLAATLLWLTAFFALRPFNLVNYGLDRVFGARPAWAHVNNTFRDPMTQEVSRGGSPLRSFQILAQAWQAQRDASHIMLMGNSQTLMANLAAGEGPPSGPEKTYTDQITDHYRQSGSKKFYRLAAGALSYEEMLWYAEYLVGHAEIKPDVLLVQLNYQNFANSGIRRGMLELLSDAGFRHRAEEIARSKRPDSDAFAKAISDYDELQNKKNGAKNDAADSPTRGYQLETAFRKELSRIPGFDRRDSMRASFEGMLVRGRYYFLHLGLATKRSLGGSRVNASRAALKDLAALCDHSEIRLILFQAPTNPAVPLYATPEDDRSYHDFAAEVASRYGLTLLDFEHSIPAGNWGMALNDPDPLHLSREGHRRLANLMITALEQNGL